MNDCTGGSPARQEGVPDHEPLQETDGNECELLGEAEDAARASRHGNLFAEAQVDRSRCATWRVSKKKKTTTNTAVIVLFIRRVFS